MKLRMTGVAVLVSCLLLGFHASPAYALSGDEILAKAEAAMNAPKDRTAVIKMTITAKGGATKERKMKILQKGAQKKMFVFLSPADVKGVGFLVVNDEKMYLYTPAFGKIRRIASHVKNENFMGTDFSYNDLSESKYPEKYSATLERTEGDNYVLALAPRPGVKSDYAKLTMYVNTATFIPAKVEMFDGSGKLMKVMTNTKVEKIDGYWTPQRVEMKDVKRGHTTVMEMVTLKHDEGLSDKTFSKRNLKKAH